MTFSEMQAVIPEQIDDKGLFAKGFVMAFGPEAQRNLNEAIRYLEMAQKISPNNIQYLNTLSEAYLQAKRPAMALGVAMQSSKLASDEFTSFIALGRAAWFCSEQELALQAFSHAYRSVPAHLAQLKERLEILTFSVASFWNEPCRGKRVALIRLNTQHRGFLAACRNNAGFLHHYHLFQSSSAEEIDRDMLKAAKPPIETRQIAWVVEKDGSPIGLAELVDINLNNSRAEIIVGFPDEQSFGISLEATLLVIEFAFSKVGIRKLVSYVYGDNPKAQKNTLHLGFQAEGLLREHVVDAASGESLDLHVNGCLASDFFRNKIIMKLANRLLGRTPGVYKNDIVYKITYADINSLVNGLMLPG